MLTQLTIDDLNRQAPSVFTETKAPTLSGEYTFASTYSVLQALESQGWITVQANQTRCREATSIPFTKHAVRLVHSSRLETKAREVPQILLTNSHNGKSSFQLRSALHVFLCSNGLVAASGVFQAERLRHVGLTAEALLAAADKVASHTGAMLERIEAFKAKQLQYSDAYTFAVQAANIRYGTSNIDHPKNFTEVSLLTPRRREEQGFDLWSVFNRVQENLTQRGLRGVRSLRNIDRNVQVNEKLWALAETFLMR